MDELLSKVVEGLKSGWAVIALVIAGITALSGGLDRAFLIYPRWCVFAFLLLSLSVLVEAAVRAGGAKHKSLRSVGLVAAAFSVVGAFFIFTAVYVWSADGDDAPTVTASFDASTRQLTIGVGARYFSPSEPVDIVVVAVPPGPRFPSARVAPSEPPTEQELLPINAQGQRLLRATIGANARGVLDWQHVLTVPPDAQSIFIDAGDVDRSDDGRCDNINGSRGCLFIAIPFDQECLPNPDVVTPQKCVLTLLAREVSP